MTIAIVDALLPFFLPNLLFFSLAQARLVVHVRVILCSSVTVGQVCRLLKVYSGNVLLELL